MDKHEVFEAVERENGFEERIVSLERELQPQLPPILWDKLRQISDLALEQLVCCLDLALSSRPELVKEHAVRA